MINLYETAVEFIGEVPPQFEIIYFFGMIFLLIMIIIIFLSPFIIFKRRW